MSRFSNLEFHRSGIALLQEPRDPDPGSAMYLENAVGSTRPLRFCGCSVGRRKVCRHLEELGQEIGEFRKRYHNRPWGEVFGATRWHRLAQLLHEGDPQPWKDARIQQLRRGDRLVVRLTSPEGKTLLELLEHSPATLRFLERIGKLPPKNGFLDRAGTIEKLSMFLRTAEEQHLNRAGLRTNRQSFEESLWYRLAYHGSREYEDRGHFEAAVDLHTGDFTLAFLRGPDLPVARLVVPRSRVRGALAFLREEAANGGRPAPETVPLLPLLRALAGERDKKELVARLSLLDGADEKAIQKDAEIARFRYGNLLYAAQAEVLVELDGAEASGALGKRQIKANRIAGFREHTEPGAGKPKLVLEDPMRELRIFREFDFLEISAGESDAVAVHYGFGDETISIERLLEAKGQGLPYLESEHGWIDLTSPDLAALGPLAGKTSGKKAKRVRGKIQLSSAQILRLKSSTSKPVRISGTGTRAAIIERLLELRPSQPLAPLQGLHSELRPYQKIGVEWLHFLWENRLAGLLCDDMGLGKTHQAMALMLLLREHHQVKKPFLVISPRTVISHWRNKLRDHAPGLRAVIYHGAQRDLDESLDGADLLIASYGVLRNDAKKLKRVPWAIAVFDEVQWIKNSETQAHQAAVALDAEMKVGLTGTPIENSLHELKNLFDLVLPGYLGDDEDYFDRFGTGKEAVGDEELKALRRLVAPFILRRLKETVLDELPEKIEDTRTCTLSDEQRDLYRETIATRGMALADRIRSKSEPLPYIHIFAVLNLLKQICDHPALALGKLGSWEEHESRKWDLFKQLLDESLASGQKVVVFTQYLGMIWIMQQYLKSLGVEYATLTGSTRKRGDVVDRFNEVESCRVFLGSLRAGGTGIDLVAGSVVIHYDRWWNAAKEDQATDRVYRIGQRRAVQVFKLLAENTLEERIAAMIDRKRQLLGDVVQADHPRLGKIFSPEELLELLQQIE